MQIEHKKNTAYYLAFPMVDKANPESFKTGETVTDTAYYKDGAGAWTSLAISDTVSEISTTGVYEIDLSASELNHDQVIIKMTSTNGADTAFLFDMRTKLVSDLNDVSAADVNAQCDTAISDAALATAANLATVDTVVDAILVDTGTTIPAQISTLSSDVATVDSNVDAILTDTGTTIPAQISALNDVSVTDILTTQMTESYSADGAAPTITQSLMLIQQMLGDFSISGTTLTVKRVDGSTTAATFTLNDGTSPTAVTRAS